MTRIQELLQKADRTTHYLHKKVGTNRTALYLVARGAMRATGPQQERIAAFFEVPVCELFDEAGMALEAKKEK